MLLMVMSAGAQGGLNTWSQGLPNFSISVCPVIDPRIPSTVYLCTIQGIYKSLDNGWTWRLINNGLSGECRCMAINPKDSSVLYAATHGGGAFRSSNGGNDWQPINNGLPLSDIPDISDIIVHPLSPNVLFAGAYPGIYMSTNEGQHWFPVICPPSLNDIKLVFSSTDPAVLYGCACMGGVVKSTDGGRHWENKGLESFCIEWIEIDPNDGDRVFIETWHGLMESTDGGDHWNEFAFDNQSVNCFKIATSDANVMYAGLWVTLTDFFSSVDGGTTWSAIPFDTHLGNFWYCKNSIAIHPSSPDVLYVSADASGSYKLFDRGQRITRVGSGLLANGYPLVVCDPVQPKVVYAADTEGALDKSTDGGRNWFSIKHDLPDPGFISFVIDPVESNMIYVGTKNHGVYKSTNGGDDWRPANDGISDLGISDLKIDPNDPTTIWAATINGLFRSQNAGASWAQIGSLPSEYYYMLALVPAHPATLYAARIARDLYKSTDDGEHWDRIEFADGPYLNCIAIDPQTPTTLYVGTSMGLFKTTDGGAEWITSDSGLPPLYPGGWCCVRGLMIDPIQTSTIYASVDGGGVFRSTEAGSNWEPFNDGLPRNYAGEIPMVRNFSCNPIAPETLYLGMYCCGVYSQFISKPFDINGDGCADKADYRMLATSLTETPETDIDPYLLDLNGDSLETIVDLMMLRKNLPPF